MRQLLTWPLSDCPYRRHISEMPRRQTVCARNRALASGRFLPGFSKAISANEGCQRSSLLPKEYTKEEKTGCLYGMDQFDYEGRDVLWFDKPAQVPGSR